MTHFGKIVLENVKLFHEIGSVALFINILVSLVLFVWGLTLIERGRTILYKHDKNRKTYDEDRIDCLRLTTYSYPQILLYKIIQIPI